jgi:hypothetical protein
MLIPFNKMPDYARVWVYQSNKNLSDSEVQTIQQVLENQINNWAAHGASLAGSVQVLHNRFVIVAVDEMQNQASGCSIDASTRWLKDLGAEMNLDFFDRSVAFLQNGELQTVEIGKIKSLVTEDILTSETLIFNNLVPNIQAFKNNWNVKASDSWMKRYFQTVTV